jgi:multicopper oxidase
VTETGERVRLAPARPHLHGHTSQLHRAGIRAPDQEGHADRTGPGNDVTVDFDAANPGRWMLHCRNAYHRADGMMTELSYTF